MSIRTKSSLLLLAIYSPFVLAQNVPPPAHPNSPYYVPPGAQAGNGSPPQAPEKWSSRWGAIASGANGKYGVSREFESKRSAVSAALKHCKSEGGIKCAIQIVYHDQCAAIVASDKGRALLQTAAYVEDAKMIASDKCANLYGEDTCWLYYSGCSLPVRVQ